MLLGLVAGFFGLWFKASHVSCQEPEVETQPSHEQTAGFRKPIRIPSGATQNPPPSWALGPSATKLVQHPVLWRLAGVGSQAICSSAQHAIASDSYKDAAMMISVVILGKDSETGERVRGYFTQA